MASPQSDDHNTPEQALWFTRVVWFMLLMGQVVYVAYILYQWSVGPAERSGNVDLPWSLFYVSIAMLLMGIAIGLFWRAQTYKRHWQGSAVTPEGYAHGNIMLLAMCETLAFVSLTATLVAGRWWPFVIPAVIAAAVQVVNFPNGRAMQPTDPDFGARRD